MPPSSPSRAASAPPVLRLSNPDEVLAAIPYVLGFRPRSSLVVLGLSGARSRLGVSMRADLGPAPQELAELVCRGLVRNGDTSALAVLYDPSQDPSDKTGGAGPAGDGPDLPGRAVVDALRDRLLRAHVGLRDVLCVRDGRRWSYLCDDAYCCPPEGTIVRTPEDAGGPLRVAATAVAAGMGAFVDRAALRATLEAPAPWMREATAQAMDRVADELCVLSGTGAQRDGVEQSVAVIRRLALHFGERNPSLSTEQAARVALALHSTGVRDAVLTWSTEPIADGLRALLAEVVRRVGPPEHVPAAASLAWCAYLVGNGALANVALEIASAGDPDYPLARLIDQSLQGAWPPELLRRATEETRRELNRRAARNAT